MRIEIDRGQHDSGSFHLSSPIVQPSCDIRFSHVSFECGF